MIDTLARASNLLLAIMFVHWLSQTNGDVTFLTVIYFIGAWCSAIKATEK